jgi:DNA-binding XRE family transcriptional regulator
MSSEVIYNRIAMLRAERGISRRELADALGMHYQTIGYLEHGEAQVIPSWWAVAAAASGCALT